MRGAGMPSVPRIYRLALLAFPRRVRAAYGDEMAAAYTRALAQRRRLGKRAARRFALTAWLDAVSAGLGSRWRRGVDPDPRDGWNRSVRDWFWLEFGTDVHDAIRSLRAAPAFAATVIAVLALGVGINGALSTTVRAALLATSPYPEADRLIVLDLATQEIESAALPRAMVWSYPKYQILENTSGLAAAPIAAYARRDVTLTGRGVPRRLRAEIVTRDYFAVLGISAAQGTATLSSESVLIGHGLALSLFGDTDPAGEELVLSGVPMAVAGVAPAGFLGLTGGAQLWVSMQSVPKVVSPTLLENFDGHWLLAIGRLRAGAEFEQLKAQMSAVGARVHEAFEWTYPSIQTGSARKLEDARRNPRARQAVGVVSAAAALVLLIACANLAVLLHTRSRGRRREIAVRLALGSSRLRMVRSMLVETLLLAAAAGALGLAVASVAASAIANAWPQSFRNGGWNMRFVDPSSLQFDLGTAVFTLALAGVAGLLFSLQPVLSIARSDVAEAMRSGGRAATARNSFARWLVSAQVAIALVLTVGAGLMVSSMTRLVSVDQGLDPNNILAFKYTLRRGSAEAEDPAAFHDAFLHRVRSLPGVVGATLECGSPLDDHCWITGVRQAGEHRWGEGERRAIGVHLVDEHHFAVLATPLVAGRNFGAHEGANTPAVAIINESAAREFFPDSNPLGQTIAAGLGLTSDGATAEIIGVVGDVLYGSPAEGTMAEMYLLHRQEPGRDTTVLVRTSGEPLDMVPLLRGELAAMAPDVPLAAPRTLQQIAVASLGDTSAVMQLLAAFATLAVLLSATGVWGTVAQAVAHRRREMGIRLALGAQARQVVSQSLRYGLAWALGGALAGLTGAYLMSRVLSSLLFEVTSTDSLAYASSVVLLMAVCLLASYLPARRAGRVDPATTLRVE